MVGKKRDFFKKFKFTKNKFDPITFFTRLKFKNLFIFWIGAILLFGLLYFSLTLTKNHSLIYNGVHLENNLMGFFNSLYFSFISATATGYGDIVGTGFSKLLAILEVITGLLIFGILISKLVSYKQEIILEEIYDISFDEKINRLRSALYLFRADVVKFIEKTENKLLTEKKLQDFWIMLVSAENTIVDIKKFICPRKRKDFIKHIDDLKFELLLNSLDLTLSKILDLLLILNEKGDTWQNKSIVKTLNGIIKPCREIEEKYMHKTLNDKIKIRVQGIKKYLYEIENLIKDF